MSKKICTAGVVGSYSYLIVEKADHEVIAQLWDRETREEVMQRHIEMDTAEKWMDQYLQKVNVRDYEVD